jgi:hypothetical protein
VGSKWYRDDEVLSRMPPEEAAARLKEIGETELALELTKGPARNAARATSFGISDLFSGPVKPWAHATHVFGFLPSSPTSDQGQTIFSPGQIKADSALQNGRINVTLNRLRIAEYPGRGSRKILFDFSGQNHIASGVEDAHFSMTFHAEQNSVIGTINYPIFQGLHVGSEGTLLRCFTVNVQNDQDDKILSALDSDVFKKGLKLATVAQPALAPFSEIAIGMTRAVASRHRNVAVQNIQMGLDFGGPLLGARLAQGDYIAVQVPIEVQTAWDWSDYAFNPRTGEIARTDDKQPIPYNYIAFGVSAYRGGNG